MVDSYGNAAHIGHDKMCASCGRFVSETDIQLADGRHICKECDAYSVRTDRQMEWVTKRVRQYLAQHGIDDLPGKIQTDIVSPETLASHLHTTPDSMGQQQGLTITTSMLMFQSHRILLLDHLHRVAAAGVMGHELLHVWQNEHSIHLAPMLTEGFCNLGSYIVYRHIGNDMARVLAGQMAKSPDPVYGDGYRLVKAVFDHAGDRSLVSTMNELRKMN